MMASPTTSTRGGWLSRYLPIWAWLPAYQRSWLGLDVIAGLTVWVLVIPEAVAYAQIAGVPPQVVLAAAPVALLAYALFATSRQVIVGSTSSIAIITAAIIAPMAAGGSERYLALAAGLAMLVLSGLLRLGFVSAFLSRSVVTGFLFGLPWSSRWDRWASSSASKRAVAVGTSSWKSGSSSLPITRRSATGYATC